jgi:hypothetical protein
MIKKIALSSFASMLLLSQVANAEIKLGDKDYFLCREMDLLMVIR